ncbi:GNAT family N-acetyltransferase [Methylobacillus pratensis]
MKNKPLGEVAIEACDFAGYDMQSLLEELEHELFQIYPGMPKPAALQPSLVLIARAEARPVGCVALLSLAADAAEIKRLFVTPSARGHGLAKRLLADLERRAWQQGVKRLLVETGNLQATAISLYQGLGYRPVVPFGPYIGNPVSRCFEKQLGH